MQMWEQYGSVSDEVVDEPARLYDTWDSEFRFQLIPIDIETPEGRMGLEFVRTGMNAIQQGKIDFFTNLWESNGKSGVFPDKSLGIVNSYATESGEAAVPFRDRSQGVDLQLLWKPIDGLQVRLGYAYLHNRVTSEKYDFAAIELPAPGAEFGPWNYPGRTYGTFGLPPDKAFANPNDTTTSLIQPIEAGGPIDDTPPHVATWWAKYDFQSDVLKGW